MIEKFGGKNEVMCDRCMVPYHRRYEADDFADMIVDIADEGWKKQFIDGEWQDFCPDCVMAVSGGIRHAG